MYMISLGASLQGPFKYWTYANSESVVDLRGLSRTFEDSVILECPVKSAIGQFPWSDFRRLSRKGILAEILIRKYLSVSAHSPSVYVTEVIKFRNDTFKQPLFYTFTGCWLGNCTMVFAVQVNTEREKHGDNIVIQYTYTLICNPLFEISSWRKVGLANIYLEILYHRVKYQKGWLIFEHIDFRSEKRAFVEQPRRKYKSCELHCEWMHKSEDCGLQEHELEVGYKYKVKLANYN